MTDLDNQDKALLRKEASLDNDPQDTKDPLPLVNKEASSTLGPDSETLNKNLEQSSSEPVADNSLVSSSSLYNSIQQAQQEQLHQQTLKMQQGNLTDFADYQSQHIDSTIMDLNKVHSKTAWQPQQSFTEDISNTINTASTTNEIRTIRDISNQELSFNQKVQEQAKQERAFNNHILHSSTVLISSVEIPSFTEDLPLSNHEGNSSSDESKPLNGFTPLFNEDVITKKHLQQSKLGIHLREHAQELAYPHLKSPTKEETTDLTINDEPKTFIRSSIIYAQDAKSNQEESIFVTTPLSTKNTESTESNVINDINDINEINKINKIKARSSSHGESNDSFEPKKEQSLNSLEDDATDLDFDLDSAITYSPGDDPNYISETDLDEETEEALLDSLQHGTESEVDKALETIAKNARGTLKATANSIISLRRSSTKQQPRKDLIENIQHGTSIFPLACYVIKPRKYSARVPLHWHPELELVHFTKGKFSITIDMQDIIIENDAFLLLPGNIMHTFNLPANCEESAIVFDAHMLLFQDYDEVQSEIFNALMTGNIPLPPIIKSDHPAFTKVKELYDHCINNYPCQTAAQRLSIKAKLLEMVAIFHDYGLIARKEIHTNIKRSKQDKLKELLAYIDTHYAGPITVKDASIKLGVTDQYFCRFFKRVTGMSFTEYLNDIRLRRAAKEIEFTTRPISEIAYEHGFENAGYFFKIFKTKFDMTPLQYRKAYQKIFILS